MASYCTFLLAVKFLVQARQECKMLASSSRIEEICYPFAQSPLLIVLNRMEEVIGCTS